ncbi:MAG: hypothetical protein L0H79_11805 [Intrasporangium sp.]|uniref:acyl-CoA thioesterase n=1 Tax=Intrasporangium sp. TaxID=1925024 RepID=UPI002649F1EB|nr:thioesterase family protein [Intrasporangium sp.]MDN5796421.1 hypothetical protein [Intrasporangium sp.]
MTVATLTGVVAWSDTDASGRYHYTAAYRWAENAEHALYRSVDPQIDIGRFPRRATSAVYEQPLAAGDEYTVELDVERVGTSSIAYAWTVSGATGVCVRGKHTVVHVDQQGMAARLPDAIRAQLGDGEGLGVA